MGIAADSAADPTTYRQWLRESGHDLTPDQKDLLSAIGHDPVPAR
ncbi:hypothetical protein [Streptomyces cyaneofuscatus]